MSKYKIGITEAGDAGLDLSWQNKMDSIDGAILITKNITPDFSTAVLTHKNKAIIHATMTGHGNTVYEPNVPALQNNFNSLLNLINRGFPKENIVIRIDPIIPTFDGIRTASEVFKLAIDNNFNRFRISIIDMYPHARQRFVDAGIPLPYGAYFSPSNSQIMVVDDLILSVKKYWNKEHNGSIYVEACAEPQLSTTEHCGCISTKDFELLGLDIKESDNVGYQRKNCLCYSGKTELLSRQHQCPHKCLYCYWK